MRKRLPLSALLSHALVAFTIEIDNEAERRTPHTTTRHGAAEGAAHAPWLVSMVMWCNCMQFVDEKGITVRELERRARTKTNLAGMVRWGHVTIEGNPSRRLAQKPRPDAIVRATPAGGRAHEVWPMLFPMVEDRWRERFGERQVDELRQALCSVASQFDSDLPDCLPILGYGLYSRPSGVGRGTRELKGANLANLPLSALLSRVLLAFATEFESEADLSLAISANLVRVIDEKGVRLRDLPRFTGVSKESLAMALGILRKKRMAIIEKESSSSGGQSKVAYLTKKGRDAREQYYRLVGAIEERWESRFGPKKVRALRQALETLAGEPKPESSPLFRGIAPYPDGWRASVRKPEILPHYPMILHRGGFPDGS